jgi:hypothetical protein
MLAGISKPLIFVVISVLVVVLVCSSFTPFTPLIVYAEAPAPGWLASKDCGSPVNGLTWCCWAEKEGKKEVKYCQTCVAQPDGSWECTTKEKQSLEQPPTPQPFDPTAPLQGGVLEQPPTFSPFNPAVPLQGGVLEQEQTPPPSAPGASPGILEQLEQGSSPGLGFSERQQPPPADQGATELSPPTTEQTQLATVEEEPPVPVCQEGLEFNEDLGFCVPTDCPEGQVLDEEIGICVLEEQPAAAAEEPEEQQQQTEEEQSSEESGSEEDNGNN